MKMVKASREMKELIQDHEAIQQAIQNDPYFRGYNEARLVMDSAFRPGYCTIEESHLIAVLMLEQGLSGEEARNQFHGYLDGIREGRKPAPGSPSGDNKFLRSSAQAEQLESVGSINARWMKEMSGQAPGESLQELYARRQREMTGPPAE